MSLLHFTIPGYNIKVNRAKFYGQIFFRQFKEQPFLHVIFGINTLFLLACSILQISVDKAITGTCLFVAISLLMVYAASFSVYKNDHGSVIIDKLISLKHNDKNHSPAMAYFLHFFKNDMGHIYSTNQTEFQKILNNETDLNYQNNDGDTLLSLIVRNMPHSPYIFELLVKGADPHIANNEGISPYDVLREKNEPAFIACVAYEKQTLMESVNVLTKPSVQRL